MERAVRGLDVVVSCVENVAMIVVGAALLLMMLIVTTDVALRYLFNSPFSWSYDFIDRYAMAAAFFLAVSYTLRTGGHLGVDVFISGISNVRALSSLRLVGDVLALLFSVGVAAMGLQTTMTAWTNDEILPGVVAFPTWASDIVVPAGMGILSLRLVVRILEDLQSLALNRPLPKASFETTGVGH